MDGNIIIISLIAVFCGIFAGMLGSPGFTLIVPLLMDCHISLGCHEMKPFLIDELKFKRSSLTTNNYIYRLFG